MPLMLHFSIFSLVLILIYPRTKLSSSRLVVFVEISTIYNYLYPYFVYLSLSYFFYVTFFTFIFSTLFYISFFVSHFTFPFFPLNLLTYLLVISLAYDGLYLFDSRGRIIHITKLKVLSFKSNLHSNLSRIELY